MAGRKKYVWAAAVLLIAGFLLFFRLGVAAFQDYDEATYAEITSESLAHGNYLSFTFLNNPFLRKPPLLFWLTSVSREIIPNEEVADRLPGALAALALVALVMAVCLEAGTGLGTAVLGGAILATTSAFIEPARQVRFDVLVSLFILATFHAVLRARRDARWYVLAGIFLGLAILSKGIIAVFALVAAGVYALSTRTPVVKEKWVWYGVLAFLVVALPWHMYETIRYGFSFWQTYFGNEVLTRVSTNLFPGVKAPSNLGYLWYLFTFGAPWTELFAGLLISLPFIYKKYGAVFFACVATVLSVLAVMFLSHTKATSYLLPLYPFMAVALALYIGAAAREARGLMRVDILCALGIALVFGLSLTAYNAFHINSYFAYQDELAQQEKTVGTLISHTQTPAVYEYQDSDIGSIQYYARLPFTNHPYLLLLSSDSTVQPGSLVITPVSSTTLAHDFSNLRITSLYEGSDVSLFSLDSNSKLRK